MKRRFWQSTLVLGIGLVIACGSKSEQSGGNTAGAAGASASRGGSAGGFGKGAAGGGAGRPIGSEGGGGGAAGESELGSFIDGLRVGAGKCLPRTLPLTGDLKPNCKVFGAVASAGCSCTSGGRAPASDAAASAVRTELAAEGACGIAGRPACSSFCACEVLEATGASEQDCLNNPIPAAASTGWCYVAPGVGIGSDALVSACPANWRQILVFLGAAQPATGESLFLACAGGAAVSTPSVQSALALGAPCVASIESDPSFSGFNVKEVSVDLGSPACASGVCLANHFQGRASCPYGQAASGNGCFVPGSGTPVLVQVGAQLVARPAATSSVCSCHCAGSGPGPYCSCSSGMQCAPLIEDFGIAGESSFAGSYCVPNDSAYDPTQPGSICDSTAMNCGPARPD